MPRGGPLTALFRFYTKRTIQSYRRSGDAGISKRVGFPVVLLTTRAAKTNQERTTPLGGFKGGDDSWLVVASLMGAARHPAWLLNMAAHPDHIWLDVEKQRFKVRAETLEGYGRTGLTHYTALLLSRLATAAVSAHSTVNGRPDLWQVAVERRLRR